MRTVLLLYIHTCAYTSGIRSNTLHTIRKAQECPRALSSLLAVSIHQ